MDDALGEHLFEFFFMFNFFLIKLLKLPKFRGQGIAKFGLRNEGFLDGEGFRRLLLFCWCLFIIGGGGAKYFFEIFVVSRHKVDVFRHF